MKRILTAVLFAIGVIATHTVWAQATVGTVTEVRTAASYLYMQVDVDGNSQWIATTTSAVKVAVGDRIEYQADLVMKNFASKALNMTFESLVFADRIRNLTHPDPIADKPIPQDDVHRKATMPTQAPKADEIRRTEDGETIAGIWDNRQRLKDRVVNLRAKVMKVSNGIIGKNWVTLQDGTGASPNNVLVVTTQAKVFPGDIMDVTGRVKTDVDLGSGYFYALLLEEGVFSQVSP